MEELEQWKRWLAAYPGWQGQTDTDETRWQLDSCGLFPQGMQVLHRQADVVGNHYLRCRSTCQLRLVTTVGEGARWHTDFAQWALEQSALGNCPLPGSIPHTATVSAEKGRLQRCDPGGTATYCIDLIAEYTRVCPAG